MIRKFFNVVFAYIKLYNKKDKYKDYKLLINEIISFIRFFELAKRDKLFDIKDNIKMSMKNLYDVNINETKDRFYFLTNDMRIYYFLKYAFFLEERKRVFSLFSYLWFNSFKHKFYSNERLVLRMY